MGALYENQHTFFIIFHSTLPRIRDVSDKIEKFKTHILHPTTCFEKSAVYKIMWKNFVQPGRL